MNDLHPDDEPLLDGLARLPPGAWDLPRGDGALRHRLLVETTAIVRTRGRRRRVRRYTGFALAYAAGIATAALLFEGPAREVVQRTAANMVEQPADDAIEPDRPAETAPEPPSPLASTDPVALRRQVAAAPHADQIELLRRAGDLYLARYGDLESALDCYRQVLELTPPAERGQFDADDSWLLAELKHAQVATAFAVSEAQ